MGNKLSGWIIEKDTQNAVSWGGKIEYNYLLNNKDVAVLLCGLIFQKGWVKLYFTETGGKDWRIIAFNTLANLGKLRKQGAALLAEWREYDEGGKKHG